MNAKEMNVAIMIGTLRTPLDEGTGKSVLNLAKNLQEKVGKVFIFTRDSNHKENNLPSEEVIEGVRVIRKSIKPSTFLHNRKVINSEDVDLLHIHTSSAKMALYASKLTSNTLWTIPAYRSSKFDEKLWSLTSNQKALATSDDLQARSPAEAVIPYGIDTENYDVHRNPSKKDELTLLYMGAPNKKRGFLSAIKIVKHLQEIGENVEFKVAVRERDNQKQKAKEMIEENNLSELTTIKGFIEDLPAFYNSVDILLNPIKDASGVTSPPVITLEAMSCGRVVCCTNIADFRNLIDDGDSGILFEYGKERQLAEQISNLSDDEMKNLSLSARNTIETRYSWSYITGKYIETYEEIVNGKS